MGVLVHMCVGMYVHAQVYKFLYYESGDSCDILYIPFIAAAVAADND